MRIEPSKIEEIRIKFGKLNTRRDLLNLLNEVKDIAFDGKTYPFKLNQLTWYAAPRPQVRRYNEFSIKKKSGSERTIHAPVDGLKAIQKCISIILQSVCEPHPDAMGFVMGRSIVDNASVHKGSRFVYNLDLKDFFPSVDQARVWRCLQLKPFELTKREEDTDFVNVRLNPIVLMKLAEHVTESSMEGKARMTFRGVNGRLGTGRFSFRLVTGERVAYSVSKSIKEDSLTITLSVEKGLIEAAKNITSGVIKGKMPRMRRIIIATLFRHALEHQKRKFGKDNRGSLANLIASLCCTDIEVQRMDRDGVWVKSRKNVLPQGAPTSPVLTNIVCRKLDHKLNGVAKRFGLRYSRYADDITFSSMHNVYNDDGDFAKEVRRVISEQGFHVNENKTRLQRDGQRKEVTGLTVNEEVNVTKRYVKQIRMWLYYWDIYGYDKASRLFTMDYIRKKVHVNKNIPQMIDVIKGKLKYMQMVKGMHDNTYANLYEKFTFLSENNIGLGKVLDVWESEGIEKAIEIFKEQSNINNNG